MPSQLPETAFLDGTSPILLSGYGRSLIQKPLILGQAKGMAG